MNTYIRPLLISMALCLGLLPGRVSAQNEDTQQDRGFEITKNLEIFSSVYKNLNLYYVDDVEPGKVMKTAIDAMLSSLDPYTNYYPESAIEDVKLQLMGEYGGIGALIYQRGDSAYISVLYEGCPAQKEGLKPGDRFVTIDGESTAGKNTTQISEHLRGQAGTTVVVQMERDGKTFKRTIKREAIKLPDIPYSGFVKGTDVGYIKLNEFMQGAAEHVRTALENMKRERPNMTGLILDLRGNGGGLLNEAVDIVNLFVKRGELIVETKGRVANMNSKNFTTRQPVDLQLPVAVLVNGATASASEIVSGSLQDLDRAVVIGSRTFGKGLVQHVLPMNYNTQMKVTVSKYYIPSGRCVQAIDYAHRDANGRPLPVPDSLKTAFKTRNGRTVYDGFGIEPDVEMKTEYMSMLEMTLLGRMLLQDYAVRYGRTHATIPPAADFEITDEIFEGFKQYLSTQKYEYNTATERMVAELKRIAKEEDYLDSIDADLTQLELRLKSDKERDLDKFRPQIAEQLKSEILGYYYYDRGRIEGSLATDPEVKKAIELFATPEEYKKILSKKK